MKFANNKKVIPLVAFIFLIVIIGAMAVFMLKKGNSITIKTRLDPQEDKVYEYTFSFPQKEGDVITPISQDIVADQALASGIEIKRGEAILSVKVLLASLGKPYYDFVPQNIKLSKTKLTQKDVYRVKDNNSAIRFSYVEDFSTKDCDKWGPVPFACHANIVNPDSTAGYSGLDIYCKASEKNVGICDEIVQSLEVSVKEL